jgi:hypothetical protein
VNFVRKDKMTKIKNTLGFIKEKIVTGYFIALRHVIPCKVVGIDIQCPLGKNSKGEGCDVKIHTGIITGNTSFEIGEILDCVFRSVQRHFESAHPTVRHDFVGLEFQTKSAKYTIMVKK